VLKKQPIENNKMGMKKYLLKNNDWLILDLIVEKNKTIIKIKLTNIKGRDIGKFNIESIKYNKKAIIKKKCKDFKDTESLKNLMRRKKKKEKKEKNERKPNRPVSAKTCKKSL
jgi:hypothetical protein